MSKLNWPLALLATTLLGCGGGGGGSHPAPAPAPNPAPTPNPNPTPNPAPATFTVGGTVSGLSGTVFLQNNAADDLTVSANGAFAFATTLATNSAYAVSIKTQPANQVCVVANGAGTIATSNVTNVTITCTTNAANTFSVSGTVTGLTGTVVLQNNAADNLTVTANGTFTFATPLATNSPYVVSVLTQPAGQSCTLANAAGTIGQSNITDVAVTCTTTPPNTHTLGGTVTGLNGNSVVLQNNGGNDVTVSSTNPGFTFGSLPIGSAYVLTVKTHPSFPAANCVIGAPQGTVADTDINVAVTCTPLPVPQLSVDVDVTDVHAAKVSWPALDRSIGFNLLVSTARDCDFRGNVTTCPGERRQSVLNGDVIRSFGNQPLRNGQPYYFQLEAIHGNGSRGLSNRRSARPNELAFNGPVRAIAAVPDGSKVYLGGLFSSVGVLTGSAVSLDPIDGTLKDADFPIVAGDVFALTADGNNGWYIGGTFTHVGSEPRRNLAHILANGSVDPNFTLFPDGQVNALKLVGGTLFVGGSFNQICLPGDVTCLERHNVAALSTAGSITEWAPQPSGTVFAFATLGNELYVGGDFPAGNGKPGFLAQFDLNIDGSGTPLSSNPTAFDMGLNKAVRALLAHGNRLYLGGQFFNGEHCCGARIDFVGGIARRSPTFSLDTFDGSIGGRVNALALSIDGNTLYLGGVFTNVAGANGNVRRINLAAVSAETGLALPWAPDADGAAVDALAVSSDGVVYAAGSFTNIGSTPRFFRVNLAALDGVTAAPLASFHPDPQGETRVLAFQGNTLYAGGTFNHLRFTNRRNAAAIDAAGSLLLWNPQINGQVNALAVRPATNTVYVGGSFSLIGNVNKSNLAALDGSAGALDGNFAGGANGQVNAIAVLESAGVYVGGSFSSAASEPPDPVHNLAKLFFNGTLNGEFHPEPTGPVNALLATHDADLGLDVVYAGGNFSDVAGPGTHKNLVKLNADRATTTDAPLNWTQHPDGPVSTLALSSDGRVVYAGGAFGSVNSAPTVGGLAALDADGTTLLTGCRTCFNPGPGSGQPFALAVSDINVFVGGSFSNIGGNALTNFAIVRGYLSGQEESGFSSRGFGFPTGPVNAIAVVGTTIYLGGAFSSFNGSLDGRALGGASGNFAVVSVATGGVRQ